MTCLCHHGQDDHTDNYCMVLGCECEELVPVQPMTQEREEHLASLQEEVRVLLGAKYRMGAAKYPGGGLWEKTAKELIEEAIQEALDQITYLLELRKKI